MNSIRCRHVSEEAMAAAMHEVKTARNGDGDSDEAVPLTTPPPPALRLSVDHDPDLICAPNCQNKASSANGDLKKGHEFHRMVSTGFVADKSNSANDECNNRDLIIAAEEGSAAADAVTSDA